MKKILLAFALVAASTTINAQTKVPPTDKRCTITTKAGTQCKNRSLKDSEYCFVHSPKADRCGQPTKAGTPCKILVKEPGQHCRFHR